MTRWLAPLPVDLPPVLLTWLQDPLLTELLVRRGFTNVASARAFLNPDDYEPSPPTELPDLSRAVDRLSQAIDAGERICVWGDFDVDGQTATTVLLSTLQELGAEVRFYIPDRLTESHGIARPALERQFERGLDLLLTCDTGVTAFEAATCPQPWPWSIPSGCPPATRWASCRAWAWPTS
jgi:single-stranded-DNA-specific exonuclease